MLSSLSLRKFYYGGRVIFPFGVYMFKWTKKMRKKRQDKKSKEKKITAIDNIQMDTLISEGNVLCHFI